MDTININLPTSWQTLTQPQLLYILTLSAEGFDTSRIKAYAFLRFTGMQPLGPPDHHGRWTLRINNRYCRISPLSMAQAAQTLDFLDTPPTTPIRLETIQGHPAVDTLLHHVTFNNYLHLETLYQAYLQTQDQRPLRLMGTRLYPNTNPKKYTSAELLNIILWYTTIKQHFANTFTHLFAPAPTGGDTPDIRQLNDTQIRALTGGDITKEQQIMQADCWRALTELDAKAHDAQETAQRFRKSDEQRK